MEVEGFLFQFCEVTSIGKNPQENLTFIHDNLKINKLSIYWLKTKSYVEKWRKFPINKFLKLFGDLKYKKIIICNSMFLVYICISPRCKSLPLKRKNMMMELVLWKCKRTRGQVHAAALQSTSFGELTFIVWILIVFFGRTLKLSLTANGLSPSHPHPFCETAKSWSKNWHISTIHVWSLMVYGKPTQIKSSWVVLVIVSIMVLCGYQSKCWLAMQTIHFHFPGRPSNRCLDLELILWSEVVGGC